MYSLTGEVPFLTAKEKDNTWLQLPICPALWRCRDTPETVVDCSKDSTLKCHANFAHPSRNVLQHALSSGYVVCCQSFVFAEYGPSDTNIQRVGCTRGEAACKYFHPPEHLALLVINAGRNNKRLRKEMASKISMAKTALLPNMASTTTYAGANPGLILYQMQQQQQQPAICRPHVTPQPDPPGTSACQADMNLIGRKRGRSQTEVKTSAIQENQSPQAKRRSLEFEGPSAIQQQLMCHPNHLLVPPAQTFLPYYQTGGAAGLVANPQIFNQGMYPFMYDPTTANYYYNILHKF